GPSHKPMVRPSRSMGQRRNKSAGTKRSSPCRRTGILSVQLPKWTRTGAPSPLVPRIPSRRTQSMDFIPSPDPDSPHGMSHRGGGCGQVSLQEHVPPALHNLIHALGYGVVPAMRYMTNIQQVQELAPEERDKLSAVTGEYVFRLSKYYHSLIDWEDPDDPMRHIVIPHPTELDEYGRLDPSDEAENYVAPGCQHKYGPTALLMVSEACASYCRFCFRKRLFKEDVQEASLDVSEGIRYIAAHPEINNVLLTGGDPLLLSVRRLDELLRALREIPHVKIIRIGSKVPAFDPESITGNGDLLAMLARHTRADARIYVMAHFNHPRELTPQAVAAVDALMQAGVTVVNQTPLL